MAPSAGRVAIVTGASAGIGKALVTQWAAAGLHQTIVARREELLNEFADALEAEHGERPEVVVADITAPDTPQRVIEATLKRFGKIEILVNNAGASRPIELDQGLTDDDVWMQTMELNFHAGRRLTHAIVPVMKENGWGRIVNVSGTSEYRVLNAVFPAKAALHAWSKALSKQLGQWGITVNSVPPGRVHSEQIGRIFDSATEKEDAAASTIAAGRYGFPEEVAEVISFLASEAASYVSGEIIHVDGGMRRFAF